MLSKIGYPIAILILGTVILYLILGDISTLEVKQVVRDEQVLQDKKVKVKEQVSFPDLMLSRQKRISRLCSDQTASKPLNQPGMWNMISFPLQDLPSNPTNMSWIIWCPVYKAASSNWFYRMSKALGATTKQLSGAMNVLGKKMTGSRTLAWVEKKLADHSSTISFVVVRNPLDRLVSTYRNKFECKRELDQYMRQPAEQMVKQYRNKGLAAFGHKNYQKSISAHRACKSQLEPTFWEFVQFVLHHPTQDLHWKPYSQTCGICKLGFSYILQFEQLAREETEFLAASGLSSIFPPMYLNRESKAGEESPTLNYLQMLRRTDFHGLMDVYRQDIEMGGYEEEVQRMETQLFTHKQ